MIDLEKLRAIGEQHKRNHLQVSIHADEFMSLLDHITALEQEIQEQCRINGMGSEREAALLSKVTQLEKDAARLDWLESSNESHGFCHAGYGEYLYYVHRHNGARSVRDVIDTAMEAKHG